MKKLLKILFNITFNLAIIVSCVGKKDVELMKSAHVDKKKNVVKKNPHTLVSLKVENDQLILTGSNLDSISKLKMTDLDNFNENFTVESSSDQSLVAKSQKNILFTVGTLYNLIITDAHGQSSYTISFNIPNGSITADKLHQMNASQGQFLKWDGNNWKPSDLSGLNFKGAWKASTNTPTLTIDGDFQNGDYYIVSVAGTRNINVKGENGDNDDDDNNSTDWSVGDWAVYSEHRDEYGDVVRKWNQVSNSGGVNRFKGRTGNVSPQENDYTWGQINKSVSALRDIADVKDSTPSAGQFLAWNGDENKWAPSNPPANSAATSSSNFSANSVTTSSQEGLVIGPDKDTSKGTGELRFQEMPENASGDTANYVAIKSPASLAGNFTFTLPDNYGSSGQFLQTNGNGGLVWASAPDQSGDNFGDHTAAQNIQLGSYYLSGDGGNEGIKIDSSGNVGIGKAAPSTRLDVNGTIKANSFYGEGASLSGIISSSVKDNSLTVADLDFASTSGINIPGLANDPASTSAIVGQTYYNTTRKALMYFNGTSWATVGEKGGTMELKDNDASNFVAVKAPDSVESNYSITLPTSPGLSGQYLSTSGNGFLTWENIENDHLGNHTASKNIRLNSFYLSGDGENEGITIDASGNVGIGTTNPTANLDVNGKIRGKANVSYDSSAITPSTTSKKVSVFNPDISTSITLQKGDIVKVDLACNLQNPNNFVYMRIAKRTGIGSWLQVPNWITISYSHYSGGYSTGIYKASADGTATFQAKWHVGGGTGYAVYCNINAYVIGN